ncbi:MAG TPA: glycosyltransferase family 4 protein [Vicinamibacterales bacterium]|nr:glycosyltransferase family 4 protein [Vicinamibacterales bacterium]
MRLLIATDAFPPVCGGSGWSTYELAKGLRARGHEIAIVQPRLRPAAAPAFDGFEPIAFPYSAPPVPFVRNFVKNERLYPRFAAFLRDVIRRRQIEIVHAQHLLTGPAGIAAARAAGVPAVCTVRDYWPVCYWSDLIVDRDADTLCPACTPGRMTRCVRPHAGAWWPVAIPAIPYMRSNLALKRRALADADAVVAVSGAMARDLRARAPELAGTRLEVIPNPVDVEALRAQAAGSAAPVPGAYALFVGKLEPNKGVRWLLPAIERARLQWPLVVVGDGSGRAALEAEAAAAGREVTFTGWLSRAEVLAWMQRASLLVFPSHGPESLSRVLLEASALGVPIAAMETGGTADIVVHEETGLLARSPEELGDQVARLAGDPDLRARFGGAARQHVERTFDSGAVVARIERLYLELAAARRGV